jgi:hypothetical protein
VLQSTVRRILPDADRAMDDDNKHLLWAAAAAEYSLYI